MRYLILVIIVNFLLLAAQYNIKSPYLSNPDLIIGYVDSAAGFWQSAWDGRKGGFYTNIDRQGNVIGTNKNMLTQSRDAYGLTRAFMLTGDTLYLDLAKQALDFMFSTAWDTSYGGWYGDIDENGNPIYPTNSKTAFDQHYALLGPMAYWEATADTNVWNWIMKGYDQNEQFLWDSRLSYEGYYDQAAYNWSSVDGKSFNATVDAITTHMLNLYLLTGESVYWDRLQDLAANILDYLVSSMDAQVIGFAEEYDSQWAILANKDRTIMGHVLKTAWCLERLSLLENDPTFDAAAEKLADDVLDKGYDFQFGGPYKDYNRLTGDMLMYGNPDTAKAWWQMEQAITSGIMLYENTGVEKYLQMADESLDFFMNYFVDHTYGEIYENRTRYGGETWGTTKGNAWKAAYHSIETGYYVYLYGNLMLHREPVLLHYNIKPMNFSRTHAINPIAWENEGYAIDSVYLDGAVYSDFNASNREINLPAGVGGHFLVKLDAGVHTGIIANNGDVMPVSIVLRQNYPNPFNATTVINFELRKSSHVTIEVFNTLGQKITELIDSDLHAGSHSVVWQADHFSSGTYFYRLRSDSQSFVRRMVLMK